MTIEIKKTLIENTIGRNVITEKKIKWKKTQKYSKFQIKR